MPISSVGLKKLQKFLDDNLGALGRDLAGVQFNPATGQLEHRRPPSPESPYPSVTKDLRRTKGKSPLDKRFVSATTAEDLRRNARSLRDPAVDLLGTAFSLTPKGFLASQAARGIADPSRETLSDIARTLGDPANLADPGLASVIGGKRGPLSMLRKEQRITQVHPDRLKWNAIHGKALGKLSEAERLMTNMHPTPGTDTAEAMQRLVDYRARVAARVQQRLNRTPEIIDYTRPVPEHEPLLWSKLEKAFANGPEEFHAVKGKRIPEQRLPARTVRGVAMPEKVIPAHDTSQSLDKVVDDWRQRNQISDEEWHWSRLSELLANRKSITRDQLLAHTSRQLPNPHVSVLGKNSPNRFYDAENLWGPGGVDDRNALIAGDLGITMPGGRNYREYLFTWPQAPRSKPYFSDHFRERYYPGGRNLLAHMRVKDRDVMPFKWSTVLEPAFGIEEVQSDLRRFVRGIERQGRRKSETWPFRAAQSLHERNLGRYAPMKKDDIEAILEWEKMLPANDTPVELPYSLDAPFVRNPWKLAFKQALGEAAETGKKWITWPTGKESAKTNQVTLADRLDSLRYQIFPGQAPVYPEHSGRLSGYRKGENIFSREGITISDLPNVIGAEAAERMLQSFNESRIPIPSHRYNSNAVRRAFLIPGVDAQQRPVWSWETSAGRPLRGPFQSRESAMVNFPVVEGANPRPYVYLDDAGAPLAGLPHPSETVLQGNIPISPDLLVGKRGLASNYDLRPEHALRGIPLTKDIPIEQPNIVVGMYSAGGPVNYQTKSIHGIRVTEPLVEKILKEKFPLFQILGPTVGAGLLMEAMKGGAEKQQ